jgi:hypothetical protein
LHATLHQSRAVVATSRATVRYRARRCAAWCATLQHAAQRYNYRARGSDRTRPHPARRESPSRRGRFSPRRTVSTEWNDIPDDTPRSSAASAPISCRCRWRRILSPRRRHVRPLVPRVSRATCLACHVSRSASRRPLGAGGEPVSTLGAGGEPVSTLGAGGVPVSTLGAGGVPVSTLGAGGVPVSTLSLSLSLGVVSTHLRPLPDRRCVLVEGDACRADRVGIPLTR